MTTLVVLQPLSRKARRYSSLYDFIFKNKPIYRYENIRLANNIQIVIDISNLYIIIKP